MAKGGRPYKVHEELKSLFLHIMDGNLKTVKEIVGKHGIDAYDPDKRTALINASFFGNVEIARWLIENGAEINYQDKNGLTALHFAAQEKKLAIVNLLIENRADPNLKDKHGNSPLWTAIFCARGDFEITKALIRSGADVESENNYGKSPCDLGVSMYGGKFFDLMH